MNSPAKIGTVDGALNRWDELMNGHVIQSNVMHDTGSFLPWHRLYMRAHEILLQTECGYAGGQPYWDEQAMSAELQAGSTFADSSLFDADTGFGGDGGGDDGCVVDGPFANLTLHLNHTSNFANYCLTRSFNDVAILTQANATYADACLASEDYAAAWLCFKAKPHTAGHAAIGGTVSSGACPCVPEHACPPSDVPTRTCQLTPLIQMLEALASCGDPLFFLHHTNLDRLWWEWQSANLSSRLTDMSGRTVPLSTFLISNNVPYPSDAVLQYDGDWPSNETSLNHNLWMVGLIPNATVGDVMDIRESTICAEYV